MPALPIQPSTLAAIVITLSFAAGLNVYATVFSLGLMARVHWLALPDGLHLLADTWIITVSGILFLVEIFADKIPGFDLVWNALHTFIRIPVATLLAYAAGNHLTPEMHLVVTCLGALVATIAHSSKTAMRIAVTPSPEPVSNMALSTTEDLAAVGLSWFALHHPIAAGTIVAILTIGCVIAVWMSFKLIRKSFQWLYTDRRRAASS